MSVFADDFVGPNFEYLQSRTPNVGDGWERHEAYPNTPAFIQEGLCVSSHSDRVWLAKFSDVGTVDGMTAVVNLHRSTSNRRCGVVGRCNDPTSPYVFFYALTWSQDQGFELWKRFTNVYGNTQELVLQSLRPALGDEKVNISLVFDGSLVKGLVRETRCGKYLQPDGSWDSGFAYCFSVSDVDVSGVRAGIYLCGSYLDAAGEQRASNLDSYTITSFTSP